MASLGSTSGYLGHEAELEALQQRLEAAVGGRGGFVVLRGPSGVGTTRTAHHVAARADRLGMLTVWGTTVEGLRGRPFGGVAEALEELATSVDAAALRAQLGAGAPALARMCPGLREMLPDIPVAAPLSAPDERLRLHDAVLSWLSRAADTRALVLVLDDLQFADADTRALLSHLGPAAGRQRLLLLGTWADLPAHDPGWEPTDVGADTVEIGGLDEGATGTLLAELADRPLPPAALAAIQEVSGGHPLFARELYRHLAEDGRLQTANAASLPASFEDVLAWRASRLPLEGRVALTALACFPSGAAPPLLADASGLSRGRLVEALERAVAAGMVRVTERGGHYVVAHERALRALQSATPAQASGWTNARAADTIEAELGSDSRVQAGLLADHLLAATRDEDADRRAIRYLLVAAEQAHAAYAHWRTVECLGAALGLLPQRAPGADRADLLSRLALAQAEAGDWEAALAALRTLLEGRNRPGPLAAEGWHQVVAALRLLRDAMPAGAAADPIRHLALDAIPPRDEALRARLELLGERWVEFDAAGLRSLAWQLHEGTAAATLLERTTDEADHAEVFLAQRPRDTGQTSRLLSRLRTWRRPPLVLRGMHAATVDLVARLGMFREGAQQATRYLAAAERYGSLRDVCRALLYLARCRAVLGELDVATEILAAADDVLARIPSPADLPADLQEDRLLSAFVLAHYRDADWPDLALRAEEAAATPHPQGLLLAAEAALAHARSANESDARRLIGLLLDAVPGQPPLTFARDAALLVTLAVVWEVGAAEHVPAGRLLVERARAAGAGASHAASPRLMLARLDGLLGNLPDARDELAKERPVLEAAGMLPLRAIADFDEAVILAAAGPTGYGEAGTLLERAAERFHALGMAGWVARVRALQSTGFESAAQPGGRLHFSYPAGLSRREADLVRLVASGATPNEAGRTLDLDEASAERHMASALDKIGAASVAEVPRLARRLGLGGI